MTLREILNLKLGDIPYGPHIFLITMFIAFTCPWYRDVYYQIRKKLFDKMTKSELEDWVESIHFDLLDKFLHMRDDPSMSDQKWREWLPIFRYADEMHRKTFPETKLRNLEDMVRVIIDESDEIKI